LLANSRDKLFVNPEIADLELAYPVKSENALSPTIDPMFIIDPKLFFFIYFMNCCAIKKVEIKFTFIISLISLLLKSVNDFLCL